MKIKKITLLILLGIFVQIFFAAWYVLHNDIFFHTDIARDFLLLEDMAHVKLFTLIGPRSGGIPGVFHGPLWLYLNLPAFILGNGNPVVVGWFWVLLFVATLGIVYWTAKKLFNQHVALIGTLLTGVLLAGSIKTLFNPYGAVMLFPLYFLFLYTYIRKGKLLNLVIAWFTLGLIIQFQLAFGLPILLLSLIYLVPHVIKNKKVFHLASLAIIAIPVSTFVLFDLKHEFLETKAVLSFLHEPPTNYKLKPLALILARLRGMFVEGLSLAKHGNIVVTFITPLFLLALAYKSFKLKDAAKKTLYQLYFYFYFGFWILTFFFSGVVWDYYYWPFLPMTAIVFASGYLYFDKRIFYALIIFIVLMNGRGQIEMIKNSSANIGHDGASWQFNYHLAEQIYKDAPNEFGYYIYTPDQFGYSPRYAMNYLQSHYPDKKAHPYVKKPVTYLMIAPPPSDKLFLNGDWWKKNQVKITGKPQDVYKYDYGFTMEKYKLNKKDVSTPSDPNLIQDIHFR